MREHNTNRRTVLKTIGGGVIGSAALAGVASAHDNPENNRRQDSFTWAQGRLFEMLEAEPPAVQDLMPGQIDSEGDHAAHRPIWIIASMAGTGEDGAEHSPHPNPGGAPIDHVVPLVGFSAQWHIHLVTTDLENPFANLTNRAGGSYLISADAIRAAEGSSVHTVPLFTPDGEPAVFTCPVRPHKGQDPRE